MRTARALTVSPSTVSAPGQCLLPWGCLLLGGGVSAPGDVCSQGVSASWGLGCLLRGMSAPRGCLLPGGGVGVVSQHALRQNPPPVNRITDACKTLPCPNFVAGGNYEKKLKIQLINHALNCKYTLQQHERRGGCLEDVSNKKTSCRRGGDGGHRPHQRCPRDEV